LPVLHLLVASIFYFCLRLLTLRLGVLRKVPLLLLTAFLGPPVVHVRRNYLSVRLEEFVLQHVLPLEQQLVDQLNCLFELLILF